MKSIYFAPPPTMNGKRTMQFTDVVVENLRQRELAKVHRLEMDGQDDEGVELVEYEDNLASWGCHHCEWWNATGIWRDHTHQYD